MTINTPTVFFDIKGIINNMPSKRATHYHLTKKAYVSFNENSSEFAHLNEPTYLEPQPFYVSFDVWCTSSQQWIKVDWAHYDVFGLISLMEMQEQDYSTMIVPLKKDHCTLCGGYTSLDVNADGSLLAECHLCELSNSIESQEQIQVYF